MSATLRLGAGPQLGERPQPGYGPAIALAFAVHAILLAVLIAGDKNVRYEAVLNVMDELRKQSVARVGLQVKPAPQ